jgi:hypothetical protein
MEENDRIKTSCQEHSSLEQALPSKKRKIKPKFNMPFSI